MLVLIMSKHHKLQTVQKHIVHIVPLTFENMHNALHSEGIWGVMLSWVTVCHLRVTVGHFRATVGHLRVIKGHLSLSN